MIEIKQNILGENDISSPQILSRKHSHQFKEDDEVELLKSQSIENVTDHLSRPLKFQNVQFPE